MFNKFNIGLLIFLISILFFNGKSYSLEIERNEIFTKNKLITIDEDAKSLGYIKDNIKPAINLKGALEEEEKEMFSLFFLLGYTAEQVLWNYQSYPLDSKIGKSTVKDSILSSLNAIRDLMATLEAEERLLLLITETRNRVHLENPKVEKADPQTLTLLQNIYSNISTHIQNTYGVSYQSYYGFGGWVSDVLTMSEFTVALGSTDNQATKNQDEKTIISYKGILKDSLNLAKTYKSSVKDFTNKAVSRNLDNLYVIASEMKSDVETQSVKRAYSYTLNIYHAISPTK